MSQNPFEPVWPGCHGSAPSDPFGEDHYYSSYRKLSFPAPDFEEPIPFSAFETLEAEDATSGNHLSLFHPQQVTLSEMNRNHYFANPHGLVAHAADIHSGFHEIKEVVPTSLETTDESPATMRRSSSKSNLKCQIGSLTSIGGKPRERKSFEGAAQLVKVRPPRGQFGEEKLSAKICKTQIFWQKKSQLIPSVFRLVGLVETDPSALLEHQDLSGKTLLIQGSAGRPRDSKKTSHDLMEVEDLEKGFFRSEDEELVK